MQPDDQLAEWLVRWEEARQVGRLEHPSIVPVYDLDELPDGRPFFVMKLIHGQTLAEYFGHASAWMRDVLCDLLRKEYGRDDNRPAVLPLDGGPSDAGPRHEPFSDTLDGEKVQRWTEFHEAVSRLPDDLRAVFDLLWYQEMSQAEVAALLGLAVPTVKLRWMKARLRVQQALGGAPFDDTGSPD